VTAATAPATAPRTVVVALANVEGLVGFFRVAWRLDREATARAARFRFALVVRCVGRLRGAADLCVDFLRLDLLGLRFATLASVFENRESL
jgi:hypothetical protein